MIFNGIKRRWMRKVLTKKVQEDRQKVIWPQSMVVICEQEQIRDLEVFKSWALQLKMKQDQLTVLCLVKDAKKEVIEGAICIDHKVIKWSGGFNDNDFKSVLESPKDLQINYYTNTSALLDFISNYMRSRLKVEFGNEENSMNDLIINVDRKEHQLFITELKKYLSILTQ